MVVIVTGLSSLVHFEPFPNKIFLLTLQSALIMSNATKTSLTVSDRMITSMPLLHELTPLSFRTWVLQMESFQSSYRIANPNITEPSLIKSGLSPLLRQQLQLNGDLSVFERFESLICGPKVKVERC